MLAEHHSQHSEAFQVKTFEERHSGDSGEGDASSTSGVFRLMLDLGLSPEAIGFWDTKVGCACLVIRMTYMNVS
jgi:hypothetical protein